MKNRVRRVNKKKIVKKIKIETQNIKVKILIFEEKVKNLINKQSIKDAINDFRVLINKNSKTVAAICVLVLIANLAIIFVYFLINTQGYKLSLQTRKATSTSTSVFAPTLTPKPTPTPTPTPIPLVQGPQTYSIGMKGTPEMYEVWFNTIDPKEGTQTVKLKVRNKLGKVSSVTATVKTDKLSKKYNLSLADGTTSDGGWTGSWTLNDTYNKNFMVTFSASDDRGNKSSVDLTIR